MDTFLTVVACIVLVPLLYLGSPYIAVFLTMIPIRIIGFFCKIADFFKDEPTLQNSTHNPPKKQEHKESHEEQANKSISSKPSLSPLQTSRSSPVVSTQNPKPSQPVTQVKSAPPAPQPSESEQTMKSQLDKKAQDELKKYIIQIAIVGSVLLLILAFIPLLLLFLL